jgi:hypothetical protein
MKSKLAVEKLAHYVEELLETKGLDFAKKIFTSIAVEATQDGDDELSGAALSILNTLKEIDEQKN